MRARRREEEEEEEEEEEVEEEDDDDEEDEDEEDEDDDDEEEEQDEETRRRVLPLMYSTVFLTCLSFSIVMPTLAPYLFSLGGSPSTVAWAVAIFSIGEAVGALALGRVYNYAIAQQTCFGRGNGAKTVMVACLAIGFAGAVLYCKASTQWAADRNLGPSLVLAGRLVQGLWTGGQQAVEQSLLVVIAPAEQRTAVTATFGAYAVLGFIFGPTVGAAVSGVNFSLFGYQIDAYTAPGVFVALSCAITVLTTLIFFNLKVMPPRRRRPRVPSADVAAASKRALNTKSNDVQDDDNLAEMDTDMGAESSHEASIAARIAEDLVFFEEKRTPLDYTGLGISLLVFLIHFWSFAVQETITSPLAIDLYQWSQFRINVLFTIFGVLSLLTSVCMSVVTSRGLASDRTLLVLSLVFAIIGNVLLIDDSIYERLGAAAGASATSSTLPLWRFVVGMAIVAAAFPMGRNVTLSVYSQQLGPTPPGTWMGGILAAGAFPRIIGPFCAVYGIQMVSTRPIGSGDADQDLYTDTWLVYGLNTVLLVVGLLLVLVMHKSLLPHKERFPSYYTSNTHKAALSVQADEDDTDPEDIDANAANGLPVPPSWQARGKSANAAASRGELPDFNTPQWRRWAMQARARAPGYEDSTSGLTPSSGLLGFRKGHRQRLPSAPLSTAAPEGALSAPSGNAGAQPAAALPGYGSMGVGGTSARPNSRDSSMRDGDVAPTDSSFAGLPVQMGMIRTASDSAALMLSREVYRRTHSSENDSISAEEAGQLLAAAGHGWIGVASPLFQHNRRGLDADGTSPQEYEEDSWSPRQSIGGSQMSSGEYFGVAGDDDDDEDDDDAVDDDIVHDNV